MAEAVEIDWLEFVMEDLYDLLLKKPNKLERRFATSKEILP